MVHADFAMLADCLVRLELCLLVGNLLDTGQPLHRIGGTQFTQPRRLVLSFIGR